ncbi:MAG: metal ABC transporter permease [Cyanobacteria bacterium P01_G01_bin.39]
MIAAASAKLICQQFIPFLATAAGLGATSGVMGMVISGVINLLSSSSIVLVQLFGFLANETRFILIQYADLLAQVADVPLLILDRN